MAPPLVAAAAPAAIPWLGSALAGGGALLGSVVSGMFGNTQAKRQMDFQERMSNTAHEREMADLRRSGLNPLLSGRHGGASAPSGAAASSPDFSAPVNSALSARLQTAQIRDLNSAASLKDAQTNTEVGSMADRIGLLIAQKEQSLKAGNLSAEQAAKVKSEISVLNAQRENIVANTASTVAETHKRRMIGSLYEAGGKVVDKVIPFGKKWSERNNDFEERWKSRKKKVLDWMWNRKGGD